MTECLFQGYVRKMPRLRAERMLEQAQVASVPWMKSPAAWYDAQLARIGPAEPVNEGPAPRAALSFNGVPMRTAALRQKLGQVLGGGFSA